MILGTDKPQRIIPNLYTINIMMTLQCQGNHRHLRLPMQNLLIGLLGIHKLNIQGDIGILLGKLFQNRGQPVQTQMVTNRQSKRAAGFAGEIPGVL